MILLRLRLLLVASVLSVALLLPCSLRRCCSFYLLLLLCSFMPAVIPVIFVYVYAVYSLRVLFIRARESRLFACTRVLLLCVCYLCRLYFIAIVRACIVLCYFRACS